jgi:hypothetical protein
MSCFRLRPQWAPMFGGGSENRMESPNTRFRNDHTKVAEKEGDKESPKACTRLKSCESLYTCPRAPFIRRRRDLYIPRLPSNLKNIPSVNMYMNVFYIP